jgi:fructuronate reductase
MLPADVARPGYDRRRTRIGIVHFGPGAFHRAHQAAYVDALLAEEPEWAICGVSLHSAETRDALRPQDGLYTLALLGEQPSLRVIGSVRELLCARDGQATVLARLADPAVRLVTLTVTEKGYCLVGEELDFAHPGIVHDLAAPQVPTTVIGYLVAGLAMRRTRGFAPYTVLSCDNLADNGGKLRRATLQYADRVDADLARWIASEVAFPRSMVDSITPATDDALRERVAHHLGCADAWPVQREGYAQWVVEDDFRNGRPALEYVGVTVSDDVAGFDRAKLRLLNGPHSALAYLGSLMELETVAAAMREPRVAGFIETLMREDIASTLRLPRGFDAAAYIEAILQRFRNPGIRHLLAQIAWDGSQKLPVRIFGTLVDARDAGRPIHRLCLVVAAWMCFVRRQARRGTAVVDPLGEVLASIGRAATGDARHDVEAFLQLDAMFAPLSGDARIVDGLCRAYASFGDGSVATVAQALSAS